MPRKRQPIDDAEFALGHLEQVAHRLGLEVRYEILVEEGEPGSMRGGLCRVKDRKVIFVDRRLRPIERCAALAEALGTFDLSGVFVPPVARQLIEREQG
jgi:hypothetical protein